MKYIHNIIFIIFSLIIALFIIKNTNITENYYEENNIEKYKKTITNNKDKLQSATNIQKELDEIKKKAKEHNINNQKIIAKDAKETTKSDEHLEKAQDFLKDVGYEWNRLFDIDFF